MRATIRILKHDNKIKVDGKTKVHGKRLDL